MSSSMPPLIPREILLSDPTRVMPMLSPNGERIAYLAPDKGDALQIWVRTLGKNDDRCISAEPRSIQSYGWGRDSKAILYPQDNSGDENWHIFSIDLESGNVRDLTPWKGVRCHLSLTKASRPGELLALLNVRDRKLMDVWRIDLRTGAARLEVENPGDVAWWIADEDLVARAASARTAKGGFEVRVCTDENAPWQMIARSTPDEEVRPLGFSKDGREIHLASSIASDTTRIVACNVESGSEREIASMDGCDAELVMTHPDSRQIQAVSFDPGRREWKVIDPDVAAEFEAIRRLDNGDFRVASRDHDDAKWIIQFDAPHRPVKYFLWERSAKRATFLFSHRPELETVELAEMRPITYRARDGMEIHAYLALPPGLEARKLPMVLYVHGGPWIRDYWTFEVVTQLLANRGYAVLRPNYRGSTGYGRKYLHAADREWGRAMQNDLTDAVRWTVSEGIADPRRIAILGASYGGYAALAGAVFTPDLYKCAIDMCGPSNLFTTIRSFPAYWGMRAIWNARVGNPDDPADELLLRNASPLFSAERISIPMMIGQGGNDARVKQSESEEIVAAIERNGGSATYVLYPDEGHGLVNPRNRIDFFARAEKFLAQHLGGRRQPMDTERVVGSSAIVRVVGHAGS